MEKMRKKRFLMILGIFVVFAFGLAGCATTPEQQVIAITKAVPLPADLKIVQPDASIPQELARFSGKWYGRWDEVMDHILVVEKIVSQKEVHAIYAFGAYPAWGVRNARWRRVIGEFKNGELYLELRPGTTATYRYKNGELEAEYRSERAFSTAVLAK